jgi:trimethylamine:corrinoid methyltransferase-like protein
VDAQAGHEKTLTGLAAALAGTNLIYGPGMLDSGNTLDCAMMVVDDEIARMIRKFVGGVKVDDVTLAVDEICSIAPFGDYLSTDFTLAHMRGLTISTLLDRRVRGEWEAHGGLDIRSPFPPKWQRSSRRSSPAAGMPHRAGSTERRSRPGGSVVQLLHLDEAGVARLPG